MNSIEIILLNFYEIRRRSLKLWSGIPNEYLNWKPDEDAFTIIEMIRHILEGEHLFHQIIENRGDLGDYLSPWKELTYTNLKNEITFSKKYRAEFLNMINDLLDHLLQRAERLLSKLKYYLTLAPLTESWTRELSIPLECLHPYGLSFWRCL